MTATGSNSADVNDSSGNRARADGPSDPGAVLERILSSVPPLLTLPKSGRGQRCPYTGKPRTFLVDLIVPSARNGFRPPVQAVYRRAHPQAKRGQWLIPSANLFGYLLGLSDRSVEEFFQARAMRTAGSPEEKSAQAHSPDG